MPIINFERTFAVLADEIYETASSKGFWDMDGVEGDDALLPIKIALMHTELSEALEVHRKEYDDGEADPITGFTPLQEEDFLEELADVVIRVLDVVGALDAGDVFGDIILSKMEKNRGRPHKHGKRY